MKTFLKLVGIGWIACLAVAAPNAGAMLEVATSVRITSRTDFEAPLAPLGSWVEVRAYGRCWQPAGIAVGWQPYCEGRWIWTDCGWYWDCDEPWAWACYHYGRWVYDAEFGWIWVPDIEWAPAWVYWRVGGGYIGWAPCPPRGTAIGPAFFAFVEIGRFHERVRRGAVVVNNTVVINKTTEIDAIKRETRNLGGTSRTVVVNDGPGVAVIEKATGSKVRVVPVQEAAGRTHVPSSTRTPPAPPDKPQVSPGPPQSPSHQPPANIQRSPRDGHKRGGPKDHGW